MANRRSLLIVTIWLFLAFGFGLFMGSALTGSDINFPPEGTAFAETTEALASVMWLRLLWLGDVAASVPQWAYQGITGWTASFPEISIPYQAWIVNVKALPKVIMASPALKLLGTMVGGTIVLVFVVIQVGSMIAGAAQSTIKHPEHATRRQRAYVGNVVRID